MKNPDDMLGCARELFCSHWDEMLGLRRVALAGGGHEAVHDLRVASRRFRAAFALLKPLSRPGGRTVVRQVRTITRTLGAVRNLDEALLFFASHGAKDGLAPFLTLFSEARIKEQRKMLAALKAFRPRKLDSQVREMAAAASLETLYSATQQQFPAYLSNTSLRLYGTIRDFLPLALIDTNIEERHALRIAIKKWRYFLEIVARIVDLDYSQDLERLKAYQSLLGSMNDMEAFSQLCRDAGQSPARLAAAGQLLNLERSRLWSTFVSLAAADPLIYSFHL